MTRTFNRKMKMKDTFTRILPSYNHVENTCFTKATSHDFHVRFEKSLEGKPIQEIDRTYNHKIDPIK